MGCVSHGVPLLNAQGIVPSVISVIIPTLNEADNLPATVRLLRQRQAGQEVEVVVADCSSSDGTVARAAELGCTVVKQASSRAVAMNRGAAAARGDILLFLHADTEPPRGFDAAIARAVAGGCVGGAFDFNWSSRPRTRGVDRELLRIVRLTNRIRFRWTGNFYGDQGIFVRRDVFVRLRGFPEVPLMEDVRFCQRLKRVGRLAVLQPPIKTSPRRFLVRGIARQFLADLRLLACESCGVNPHRAWWSYNRVNRQGHPPVVGRRRRSTVPSLSDPIPVNQSLERV